jgi:streptogramin lyase
MLSSDAEILREYGPFPGVDAIHGVTFDGRLIWFASGGRLNALEPDSGEIVRTVEIAAHAGTACDGERLYQLAEDRILKIDLKTGQVTDSIPAPGEGRASGMAWAEGLLWVGQYRDRKIHCVDPETGAVLRTIECDRFVTGVSWLDGDLWHGADTGEACSLRRLEPRTGELLEELHMPAGVFVSGLEANGEGRFLCGGGTSGKVRAVRRP